MKARHSLLIALAVGISPVLPLGPMASAAAIAIANPSFETPVYPVGQWGTEVPGWTVSSGATAGIENYPSVFPLGIPDGNQVAYLNSAGSVSQVLSSAIEASTTYTLTAGIGDPTHVAPPASYAMQLRAGGEVLASASPTTIDGGFVTASASYTAQPGDPRIGAPLRIVFTMGETISGRQLVFDNVRLDASYFGAPLLIWPDGGEFTNWVEVTLANHLPGAVIRYTLDGTEPVATSERYQVPVTLSHSATVRARLFVGTAPASDVYSATFTRLPDIVFLPSPGLFTNSVEVALRNTLGLGGVLYTLDGADPTAAAASYTTPFRLSSAATVKARIFLNGYPITDVATATYLRVYAVDDGIPNAWREEHFGPGYLTDPRVGALEDPDRDGANNLQEYTAASDPLDPLSGFAVGVQAVPMIQWVSVPGKIYRILRKTSLQDPAWVVVVPEFQATATESGYVDVEVAGQRAFYTVEPQP